VRRENPLFISRGEWFHLSAYPKKKWGKIHIAVPRKLYPLSTSRNRLKRQIREVSRRFVDEEQDFFITVHKKGSLPFAVLRREVEAHFKKGKSVS